MGSKKTGKRKTREWETRTYPTPKFLASDTVPILEIKVSSEHSGDRESFCNKLGSIAKKARYETRISRKRRKSGKQMIYEGLVEIINPGEVFRQRLEKFLEEWSRISPYCHITIEIRQKSKETSRWITG